MISQLQYFSVFKYSYSIFQCYIVQHEAVIIILHRHHNTLFTPSMIIAIVLLFGIQLNTKVCRTYDN